MDIKTKTMIISLLFGLVDLPPIPQLPNKPKLPERPEMKRPTIDDFPTLRSNNGYRRKINIPPEIDALAQDFRGNISLRAVDEENKPISDAKVSVFAINTWIRQDDLTGKKYFDAVAKQTQTYYTGQDGTLEIDLPTGKSYIIGVMKDNKCGEVHVFNLTKRQEYKALLKKAW